MTRSRPGSPLTSIAATTSTRLPFIPASLYMGRHPGYVTKNYQRIAEVRIAGKDFNNGWGEMACEKAWVAGRSTRRPSLVLRTERLSVKATERRFLP
ncbi:MAG: hypothetical protein IZT59_13620 [Verrucomicrobia bacterium]|nr:hypothetical protein [Verrucomicrobiota bacterium]